MSVVTKPGNLAILEKVEPSMKSYTKWFLGITEVPHETFHPEKITDKLCEWLTSLKVDFERDDFHNICVRLPANGMDGAPVVAIQAHTDMVCVGEFEQDGSIDVSLENDCFVAKKSTLGADDGVGLALMLDIIEHRNEIVHGPMELIFTSDEEQGLCGVKKLPRADGSTKTPIKPFKYKYFINCDALNGDRVYIGSNGGTVYTFTFEVLQTPLDGKKSIIEMELSGLKGGHSGACINMNRMNTIKVLARLLKYVENAGIEWDLCAFDGGEQINTIPRFAKVRFAVDESKRETVLELIKVNSARVFGECSLTDNKPAFTVKCESPAAGELVVKYEQAKRIIDFALCYKDGPLRMSPVFPEYVDTSDNFATIKIANNEVKVGSFSRSATQTKLDEIDQTVRALCAMTGLKHKIETIRAGAPWTPNLDSVLAKLMSESFEAVTGVKKPLGLVQVTIEPAEFTEIGYEADMISVCPSIPKAHTIGEFVNVTETRQWRDAIYHLLKRLTQ